MSKSKFFKEKETYETRKDLLIHFLNELNKSNKPISFGKLLIHNIPGGGIAEFESVMDELEHKGWVLKKEQDGGPVQGLPFHRSIERTYSITLEGVEYLAEEGKIDIRHSKKQNNSSRSITNYGNLVVADETKDISQSLKSPNNFSGNNQVTHSANKSREQPLNEITTTKKWSIKNIVNKIYKLTDHKLISGIILLILGIIIGKLLKN